MATVPSRSRRSPQRRTAAPTRGGRTRHLRLVPAGPQPARRPAEPPRPPRPPRPGKQPAPAPRRRRAALPKGRGAGPRRHRLVRGVSRRIGPARKPGIPFVTLASLAVAALVFGLVLLHVLLAQSAFRLADLQAQVEREQERHRQMQYELASAESPSRVAEAARSLGLVVPERQEVVTGPPEEVILAGVQGADPGRQASAQGSAPEARRP